MGRLVSTQPPWSMAMLAVTLPGRMLAMIARGTSRPPPLRQL